ncbi:molybdopterin molybdotransferase MoeA [Helicobacter pametensis]|uniref:molybdopterin molybdotransferase MoeA n=1 Tax=Helicobacter pametensis TaxID=95149 RepID=UPI000480EDBA|nr:molybdopterin molybdotransferase MoeA [Helicobacter pametensis]
METKYNISYEESLEILDGLEVETKSLENVFLSDSLNRILAQDICAKETMPSHPIASMDGYACASQDIPLLYDQGLRLVGINKAGESEIPSLIQGGCIKTFTGARMPQGCDVLILVEHTKMEEGAQGEIITLCQDAPSPIPNQWIRQIGENYKEGEILLQKGSRITPFEIGLLAELNYVFVPVYMRPKVAILSGGDEILEIGEERRENTVRSVNNHLLKAIAETLGAQVSLFPLLKDHKEQIRMQVLEALRDCDILITTGGASKGDFDYVQEVLHQECQMHFKGVRVKPGKPVGFGMYQNKSFVFGLPGFPNSCAVTFMLFVRPLIAKLLGISSIHISKLKAHLAQEIKRTDSRAEFRICDLSIRQGRYEVGFWNKKILQSSVINNFCQSSALIFLEENGSSIKAREEVDIILLSHLLQF